MPTTVDVPNVGEIEFPDSMDTDDIRSALAKKFPPAPEVKPVVPPSVADTASIPPKRLPTLSGFGGTLRDVLTPKPKAIWEAANKPAVDIVPQIPESVRRSMSPTAQAVSGAGQAAAGFAGSLTSPLAIATLPMAAATKAYPYISKALSGAFGALMAKQTAEQVHDLVKLPKEQRNPRELAERIGSIALTGGSAALASYDALLAKHPAATLPKAHEAATEAVKAKEQPPALAPEHVATIDKIAAENGDKVVHRTPTSPDEPFAGQIANINRATGQIVLNPKQVSDWLANDVPKGKEQEAIASLLSEERIHLATPDEAAVAYHDSLTQPERAIVQRVYGGKGGSPLSPTMLGHEALRMRMQQLARMDVRETLDRSTKERWTVKSLLALNSAIRGVRETLGTKASKEGIAILDRIQGNLDAALIASAGAEPGATRKDDMDDNMRRALSMQVDRFDTRDAAQYQPYLEAKIKGEPTTRTQADLAELTKSESVFHETSLENSYGLFHGLMRPFKQSWSRFFVADNPDIALGQSGKGVLFELDPGRINGYEHGKPGTGDIAGREFSIDRSVGRSVKSATFSNARQLEAFKRRFPKSFDYDGVTKTERGLRVQRKTGQTTSEPPGAKRKGGEEEPDAWGLWKNGETHGFFTNENQAKMAASGIEGAEIRPFNRQTELERLTEKAKESEKKPFQPSLFLPEVEGEAVRPSAEEAGALPSKETPLTAEQVDSSRPDAFVRVEPKLLNDPYTLGRTLTKDAAASGDANRTATRRITVMEKPGRPGVVAVSTYRDPNTGRAMLAHPELSADRERIHRTLPKVLADGWKPVASILLKEPVTNYRRPFKSLEDFEQASGFPAAGTTTQAVAETGFEQQKPVPITQPSGSTPTGVTAERAGVLHDHFGKAESIDAAVKAIRDSDRKVAIRDALTAAMDKIREQDPSLSQGQAMEKAIGEIYDETKGTSREAYVQSAEQAHTEATPVGDEHREPGVGGEMEEGTSPAAINKHAAEEAKLVRDDIRAIVTGRKVADQMARAIDSDTNTPHILATRAETNIRLPSERRAPGLLGRLKERGRGDKKVLAAANALVQAQAVRSDGSIDYARRGQLPLFQQAVADGKLKAQAMIATGSWRQQRLGRAWVRAADELKAELDYADAHWGDFDLQETARRMKKQLDAQWARERMAGHQVSRDLNYVPQRYDAALWNEHSILFGALPRILGKAYRQPKTFPTYYDAIKEGPYIPVTRDGASLVGHRVRQGMSQLYREKWQEGLKDIRLPDGRMVAIEPTQDPSGVWQSPRSDYKYLGRPYLHGKGLAVHEDFASTIRNLTGPSQIQDWTLTRKALHFEQMLKHSLLVGDFFHLGRMVYYAAAIMGKDAGFKGGLSVLDIDPHDIGEAIHKGVITSEDAAWGSTRIPFGKSTLTRRQVAEKFYSQMGANVGKIQDALYKDLITDLTPSAGPIVRAAKRIADPSVGRYNRFLFDKLTRGLMMEANVREFERQHAAHPEYSPTRIMKDISRDVNNFFGNIGKQGWVKSATQKDLSRLLLLAPDWLEGLVKKEAVSMSRLSGLSTITGQRKGLTALGTTGRSIGRGLLFLTGLTQAVNLVTRHQFTWQNEEKEHKGDAYIPAFGGGKEGFWFSPLTIFNELTHDLWRLNETRPTFIDAVDQVAGNKEAPVLRALLIAMVGNGDLQPRSTTTMGRLGQAGQALVPTPLSFGTFARAAGHAVAPNQVAPNKPGALGQRAFGVLGIKIQPQDTKINQVHKMADRFMRENHLQKDGGFVQQQTDEASYSKLRSALRNGDEKEAQRQYKELLETRTPKQVFRAMKNAKSHPFTGSKANERAFILSLDDEGLETYTQAVQQRQQEYEAFLDWAVRQP